MQTAFYIRFSREEARGEQSIETMIDNRVAQCFQICDIHKFPHPKPEYIFVEIASGGSIAKRPKIQRLLEMCAAGEVSRLVTTNVDRLSRGDLTDQGLVERSLTQGNVTLATWAGLEVYDDNRVSLSTDVLLAAARYLRQDAIKKRKQADAQRFTENKRRSGQAPYGYRRIGMIDGQDTYEVIDDEIAIVRETFRRKLAGETCYRIAKSLRERGLTPRRGGEWSDWQVRCILVNPFYAGYLARRSQMIGGKRVRYDQHNPDQMQLPEEPGTWETIVTLDEWRQAAGAVQFKPFDFSGSQSMLTGLLYCSEGKPMRLCSKDNYSCKYWCDPHPGRFARRTKITDWVILWMMQVICRIDTSALPKPSEDKQEAAQAYASVCKQAGNARARMEKLKADYQFLVELWGQEAYRKAFTECQEQVRRSEAEVNRLQFAVAMSSRADAFPALAKLKANPEQFMAYDIFQRRKIIGSLIQRIDLIAAPEMRHRIRGAKVTWWPEWEAWIGEPPPFYLAPGHRK